MDEGLCIPAGWKVLPMFTASHFDPDLHANPMEFDPWRWSKDKGTHKTVTPFGGGAQLCPGYGLAQVELAFFLHHLVLNYRYVSIS
ncbi:hypothetical protein CRG98_005958 [Punica granatum]|uniref:Uncharacterized protein n=1 Tax=Punica granatum TaxID=22663 RepID=A0A2I0KZ11_PUNGR|nr:hypothetical protein CRG98_005958 [Punica granatum]